MNYWCALVMNKGGLFSLKNKHELFRVIVLDEHEITGGGLIDVLFALSFNHFLILNNRL